MCMINLIDRKTDSDWWNISVIILCDQYTDSKV